MRGMMRSAREGLRDDSMTPENCGLGAWSEGLSAGLHLDLGDPNRRGKVSVESVSDGAFPTPWLFTLRIFLQS
jgi:hypothetical protein